MARTRSLLASRILFSGCLAVLAAGPASARAQDTSQAAGPAAQRQASAASQDAAQAVPGSQQPASGDETNFKQEELDQMLAPIALYPDDLLSQVLMASTYPLEIVQADRWAKANKNLKGDAAAKALEDEPWDASVKSLVNFPDVLAMLSEKIDWTQKLGDAFLGQQEQVMDTVQSLRAKAKENGQLESNDKQKVEVQQQGPTQTIIIQSASPSVIYVPTYNPTVVYGTWPYPAYPPYPYYPPGYYYPHTGLAFGAGVAFGFAWGYAWGGCNWGHGHSHVDIDINRNVNINNKNINRDKYQRPGQGGRGEWQHNPAHRGKVPYQNRQEAQRFGGVSNKQAQQSREQFRGRTGNASQLGGSNSATTKPTQNLGSGQRSPSGSNQGSGQRSPSTPNLGSGASRTGALDGAGSSGRATAAQSQRGRSSLSSGSASRGGGGRGGRR